MAQLWSTYHDAAGQRTLMADATGPTSTTFDPLYRTSVVANPAGKTVTYTYDLADRRSTMTGPSGGLFTYTFDGSGNLAQVTNPQGKTTTTTYDPLNRPALKQMANGAVVSQTWDAAGRLTTLKNFGSGAALVNCFTYTYDAADNRLTMTEARGSQTVWTYDPTRQLLAEARTGGIATIAWVPLSGPQWQGLTLNDWGVLLLDTDYPHVVYSTTYTYDPAGNRVLQSDSGQLTTYAYDDTNQLLTLQNPGGVTTYTADGARPSRLHFTCNAKIACISGQAKCKSNACENTAIECATRNCDSTSHVKPVANKATIVENHSVTHGGEP